MSLSRQANIATRRRNAVLLISKLVLLAVLVLGACEISWRLIGVQPCLSDLLAFAQLERAALDSSNAVALIGSSRVLCDLDPRVLRHELPKHHFYQLARGGQSGLPMLEELAKTETFRGLVLCDFNEDHVLAEYPFPKQDEYLRFIHRQPYLAFLQKWLAEILDSTRIIVGRD